ncbi:MAG: hypothetical protein H0T79_12275 [Deltaproteobacteria bacterium]|nr:hypothetical protein [Deltaproteobacteria bacterium]
MTYKAAGSQLRTDLEAVVNGLDGLKFLDHQAGRAAWQRFADQLVVVDRDLAIVAADPGFSLELCIACWEYDWNHSGAIDERDRRMFEIEFDGRATPNADGELDDSIPEGDPRRRPTFKFDVGDADWARAMVSFQRAAMEIILAYRWSELDRLFGDSSADGQDVKKIVLHLGDAARVTRARELILSGVGYADRCRTAYLAETDDDREWVPNPTQRSHPIPLDVDVRLYETWAGVTGDVHRMLTSEEGLSFKAIAALGDDDFPQLVPDAYLDLGAMLREPRDIELDLSLVSTLFGRGDQANRKQVLEKFLRGVLGKGYASNMKPSPLVGRLHRMKTELSTGNETFERKLRYLLWLN